MSEESHKSRAELIGEVEKLRARVRELEALEERLQRVGKMEAVGRLAGGVAHDFNNVLQAIQGYTDLALASLPPGHDAADKLEEVLRATDRAAALTHQLLAFGRRETIQPVNLDVNEVVGDLVKLLDRLIGDDIHLFVFQGSELAIVHADRGQLGQLIMQLCLNARDAMPDGGDLTLETKNVSVGSERGEAPAGLQAGEYVRLSVADTGRGMTRSVRERAFEPFFTTKEVGDGSGLGLASVYAIVERHGGMIELQSEPGRGTTAHVYLPVSAAAASGSRRREVEGSSVGTETILFAEDEDLVRKLTATVLTSAGYRLHVARDGQEALDLLQAHADEIDLVIADVMMPRKSGKAVYDAIQERGGTIPVLFSSGYSYTALKGNLPEGDSHLMRKPYAAAELLRRIREILDGD